MKIIILKAMVVAAYLGMLYLNYLANARPLNNRMTGEVSDAYPTLFTPAGLTFSIWGVIYLICFRKLPLQKIEWEMNETLLFYFLK